MWIDVSYVNEAMPSYQAWVQYYIYMYTLYSHTYVPFCVVQGSSGGGGCSSNAEGRSSDAGGFSSSAGGRSFDAGRCSSNAGGHSSDAGGCSSTAECTCSAGAGGWSSCAMRA